MAIFIRIYGYFFINIQYKKLFFKRLFLFYLFIYNKFYFKRLYCCSLRSFLHQSKLGLVKFSFPYRLQITVSLNFKSSCKVVRTSVLQGGMAALWQSDMYDRLYGVRTYIVLLKYILCNAIVKYFYIKCSYKLLHRYIIISLASTSNIVYVYFIGCRIVAIFLSLVYAYL